MAKKRCPSPRDLWWRWVSRPLATEHQAQFMVGYLGVGMLTTMLLHHGAPLGYTISLLLAWWTILFFRFWWWTRWCPCRYRRASQPIVDTYTGTVTWPDRVGCMCLRCCEYVSDA